MLSEQDKKDMLANAQSVEIRESFRQLEAFKQTRRLTLDEYCDFCESMAQIFPVKRPELRIKSTDNYRL